MYADLAKRLRNSIHEGGFRPGELLGSEHGLARSHNISRVTVRRASEMLIQEGLLERRPGKGLYVRDHRTPSAPHGRSAQTPTVIQVVAGNLSWDPSMLMSRGIQAIAREKAAQVQLYDAHGQVDLDLQMIRQLPDGPARGAVIISLHSAAFSEEVCRLKVSGFPFVLADQRMRDLDVPSVVADNIEGGRLATRHLLDLGHRRIAFIGDLVAATVQDRLAGMRDAMGDAGLPFNRSLVLDVTTGDDRLADWSACVTSMSHELLGRADRPTAVFASCDAVARAVYRAAADKGLSVPRDLSIVGFDDDSLAGWLNPGLTTVRQPFEAMGRAAMALLLSVMEDSDATIEHRVLPVELVVRGSTAAPPGD